MNASEPIVLTAGNRPVVNMELVDEDGAAVDLTGCAVRFAWQPVLGVLVPAPGGAVGFVHDGTVVDAAGGKVSYQFAAGETDTAGDYLAQWQVTDGQGKQTIYPYPAGVLRFRIVAPLAGVTPNNIVLIEQMREPVRAVLGDHDMQFRRYEDCAIDRNVRTCLLIGKVPGQRVGVDRLSITPGIVLPSDLALLMYHAAKMFVMPDSAEFQYRTRALSEKFGRQDYFIRELENAIYDLENPGMFSCFQSFYAWVNALTGIDIWSVMSDMRTSAPVATVNIGRAGVTVTTS